MRIQEVQIFAFEELADEVKKEVIKRNWDCNVFDDWWSFTKEDLKRTGLELVSFDIGHDAFCRLQMTLPLWEIIERIVAEHDSTTQTYQIAQKYDGLLRDLWDNDEEENNGDRQCAAEQELERGFLRAMQETYLTILREEYAYLTSDAAIAETLEANEWEFMEDGKRFD